MPADKSPVAAVKNSGCMGVWLAVWTLVTLLFDLFLVFFVTCQCWAFTYPSTQGTVSSTNIESNSDSDGGTTYTHEVNYTYTVAGQNHHGDRITYFLVSGSHMSAQDVISRFPAGQPVTVYYRSTNPADSVLIRGIDGMGLFMGMFLIPFNVIGAGVWYAFFSILGPGKPVRRWLHFRARDDGLKARLTIYTLPPLLAGGFGAGAAAFVMTFVVGFGMNSLPAFWLAIAGWVVVLAAAVFALRIAFRWVKILEVDRLSGKLDFQPSDLPRSLSAADVREIVVVGSSSKDNEGQVTNRYTTCLICHANGSDERLELCTWSAEDQAQWVRKWVSEQLRKDSA